VGHGKIRTKGKRGHESLMIKGELRSMGTANGKKKKRSDTIVTKETDRGVWERPIGKIGKVVPLELSGKLVGSGVMCPGWEGVDEKESILGRQLIIHSSSKTNNLTPPVFTLLFLTFLQHAQNLP